MTYYFLSQMITYLVHLQERIHLRKTTKTKRCVVNGRRPWHYMIWLAGGKKAKATQASAILEDEGVKTHSVFNVLTAFVSQQAPWGASLATCSLRSVELFKLRCWGLLFSQLATQPCRSALFKHHTTLFFILDLKQLQSNQMPSWSPIRMS